MKAQASWYQAVWRWHFYAGIIFAPFLIILAFSGSMYLFKPQIEGYLYKDLLTVREVGTLSASPTALMENATTTYPDLKISSLTFPDQPTSSVKMSVEHRGTASTLYADPYTGQIVGIQDNSKTFSAYFKKMHSQLLMNGTWPNRLVELSACWAFILTVTGLYLWRPRKKSAIWGTILPRLKNRGSRTFWRDMHAIPAFWLSLFILILIATGLPWSGVLGPQIDRIANATHTNYPPYGTAYMEKPDSVTVAKEVADNIPWAAENIPVPSSISSSYIPLDMNDIVAARCYRSIYDFNRSCKTRQ
ncbi:PepSY-associated TM helix [compost metagenome]